MSCAECGAALAPGARFCSTCGAPVEQHAEAQVAVPTTIAEKAKPASHTAGTRSAKTLRASCRLDQRSHSCEASTPTVDRDLALLGCCEMTILAGCGYAWLSRWPEGP